MTRMNAKAECVPGIWKKQRNAFVNCFKHNAVCTCSAERQPTPKAEDAKAQEKKVSSSDIKAFSELSESVVEFSRAYFGEAGRDEGWMGRTWSGSTDSRLGTKPRREAISSASNLPFAAWGGWPRRGIPELASALAD